MFEDVRLDDSGVISAEGAHMTDELVFILIRANHTPARPTMFHQ
jgi:hypothetical protein